MRRGLAPITKALIEGMGRGSRHMRGKGNGGKPTVNRPALCRSHHALAYSLISMNMIDDKRLDNCLR
jgi:hypothetical protein